MPTRPPTPDCAGCKQPFMQEQRFRSNLFKCRTTYLCKTCFNLEEIEISKCGSNNIRWLYSQYKPAKHKCQALPRGTVKLFCPHKNGRFTDLDCAVRIIYCRGENARVFDLDRQRELTVPIKLLRDAV